MIHANQSSNKVTMSMSKYILWYKSQMTGCTTCFKYKDEVWMKTRTLTMDPIQLNV